MAKSYTTSGSSVVKLFRGGMLQVRAVNAIRRQADARVEDAVAMLDQHVGRVEQRYGVSVRDHDVLEIGHGQFQMALAYFASRGNRAVGVDLDVTPHGLTDLKRYSQLLMRNGPKRFVKNVVRELTGVNTSLKKAFAKRQKLRRWPKYETIASGATPMPFADASFDFIYSYDVFEHVGDPEPLMRDIARVLRPGGTFWMTFLHYAQVNALHDLRLITGGANPPKFWAHLVPRLASTVDQGAFVNTLRIDEWQQLLNAKFPGVKIDLVRYDQPKFHDQLRERRAEGDLEGYADDELLCERIVATWQKPD